MTERDERIVTVDEGEWLADRLEAVRRAIRRHRRDRGTLAVRREAALLADPARLRELDRTALDG
jgi:hypothetical protein